MTTRSFMETTKHDNALEILRDFLKLPHQAKAVHDKFASLPGAILESTPDGMGFVFIPATRPSPVLLVAHADVVGAPIQLPKLYENDSVISNPGNILGADDRAGCALIWALRNLGHGILITDGEEMGCLGAEKIMEDYPELREELQSKYQFMVEFDRKNRDEYKCYDVGTDDFRRYIEKVTNFHEPDRHACTDIAVLARKICGVNLSCGYCNPHRRDEYIVKNDWLNTLQIAEKWLSSPNLPRFEQTM